MLHTINHDYNDLGWPRLCWKFEASPISTSSMTLFCPLIEVGVCTVQETP